MHPIDEAIKQMEGLGIGMGMGRADAVAAIIQQVVDNYAADTKNKMLELLSALNHPAVPPGPWKVDPLSCGCCCQMLGSNGEDIMYQSYRGGICVVAPEVAEFVVFMRNHLPEILEALER